jgi:signal transduction histidine kinase
MDVIFILINLKEQDEEKIREINKVIQRDNMLLKELNTVKDKFFSIIAHDLKTPIGSLSQLLGVLTENDSEMEPERRHKLLKTVYINSKNTYHLLNNLLLWARSESGQIRYSPEKLELTKLIDRNIELLNSSAEIKKIRIDSISDNITVTADHDMLDAIIRNLLSNAIKFTGSEGRIWLTVDTHSNGYYKVGVHDTGTGIEKEVIPSLFNLDSEYVRKGTNKEKGTGLGLKLCREFIKKNEGDIWVESEPEKGSVFYFTIREG